MEKVKKRDKARTRLKIIESTVQLMLAKGYHSTSLDEICSRAEVTKGGLFHHFKNKTELSKAAVDHFFYDRVERGKASPFYQIEDPLQRLYGYLDFVAETFESEAPVRGCLLGNLAQELHQSDKDINTHCYQRFGEWILELTHLFSEAKERYAPLALWQPKELAEHFIVVYQGAAILSKAQGANGVVDKHIQHFKRHVEQLFRT